MPSPSPERAIPDDRPLCRECKMPLIRYSVRQWCNSCTWLLVAREGWPDPQWAIIREMRDAGKGG